MNEYCVEVSGAPLFGCEWQAVATVDSLDGANEIKAEYLERGNKVRILKRDVTPWRVMEGGKP